MATIQLDQEVLDVERLIDERKHDEAFRQLILLRERYGRRPEYKYLQALFDATFEVRSDTELLREVRPLVADQPDFLEAVSLFALLLDRTGDKDRAAVFAREAVQSTNPTARRRAERVLGDTPANPPSDEEPFHRRSSAKVSAVREPEDTERGSLLSPAGTSLTPSKQPPVVMPSAGMADGRDRVRETQQLVPPDIDGFPPQPTPAPPATGASDADPFRLPTNPPPMHMAEPQPHRETLDALKRPLSVPPGALSETPRRGTANISTLPPPPEPTPGRDPTAITMPRNPIPASPQFDRPPPSSQPETKDARQLAMESIPFSPIDVAMPPPPTIPPDAMNDSRPAAFRAPPMGNAMRMAPTEPSMRTPDRLDLRPGSAPPPHRSSHPPPHEALRRKTPASLPPELAVDRTGVRGTGAERKRSQTRPSRPAIALPPPVEQLRQWFKYARENQILSQAKAEGGGFSTARTLIDLAERVVEGATPLSSEPIPLDRRGLIVVEQRLESLRGQGRGAQPATERGAVTAAAAFLLALLLKECDGRASDTSAEDGACKITVPSGATVRPLLVAAAYSRSRGPGLVESYDRAATAHMRRSPTRPNPQRPAEPKDAAVRRQNLREQRSTDFDLTVLRRDLDASTLGVTDPDTPPAPMPGSDMRVIAGEFWSSELGRELIGSSRRVGALTIADVDALERYASKTFSAVGFAPPGTPWPWAPSEELEDLVFAWGAILGEVLVGLYSGRWEADPGNPDDRQLFRVVMSGGVVAWPVAKAYMRLARGIPHDLSVYIDAVGRVVGRQALGSQRWPQG